MNKKTKLIDFDDHLDQEYGQRGTATRENFEGGFEAFRKELELGEQSPMIENYDSEKHLQDLHRKYL